MLNLRNLQINLPATDVLLVEKHEADIASVTESLSQLIYSQKQKLTLHIDQADLSEYEGPNSSQPLISKNPLALARISGPSALASVASITLHIEFLQS